MSTTIGAPAHPAPLPRFLTSLLGREEAVASLCAMLADPETRIVTLTGPGGVGKTRLAVHAAAEIEAAGQRVVFVSLSPFRDPALALRAIGQVFDVTGDVGEVTSQHLSAALAGEDVLLVLDNLEQVLTVAPALEEVLAACPGVTIVATSRAPLGISGERVMPVQPLAVPETGTAMPGHVASSDAVALFLDRARMVAPGFHPAPGAVQDIVAICRRLDGMPLAIELAAARTNMLPPRTMLSRLDGSFQALATSLSNLPDRQRTLAGTIAWSYDLLTLDEQVLFRRLGAFAGGFTADFAAAVTPEIPRDQVDRLLQRLVAHSLVQPVVSGTGQPRYALLETIRMYALELLVASREADSTSLAMATAIADLARAARPYLFGGEHAGWWASLVDETENLRTAIAWAKSHGRHDLVQGIIGASMVFLVNRGMIAEMREPLSRSLAAGGDVPLVVREQALIAAGHFATEMHDHDDSVRWFEQARELTRATGNRPIEREAVYGLGKVAFNAGRYADAAALFDEARVLSEALDDARSLLRTQIAAGMAMYYLGDMDGAVARWEDSRQLAAEQGDLTTEAVACGNLAGAALDAGDHDRAREFAGQAIATWRTTANLRDLPDALVTYGEASRELGMFADAHAALTEALEIMDHATDAWKVYARVAHALVYLREGEVDQAARIFLEAAGDAKAIDSPHLLMDIPSHLAELAIVRKRPEVAARLIGLDASFRAIAAVPPSPMTAARLDAVRREAVQALGAAAFDAAAVTGGVDDLDGAKRLMVRIARDLVGPQHPPMLVEVTPEPPAGADDGEIAFTAREREVLQMLVAGRSTTEIAEALYLSPRTVGSHIGHILAKMEVSTRTAAVAEAVRRRLV